MNSFILMYGGISNGLFITCFLIMHHCKLKPLHIAMAFAFFVELHCIFALLFVLHLQNLELKRLEDSKVPYTQTAQAE